jgi:putative DNA methylase
MMMKTLINSKSNSTKRLIETDNFPFEFLSVIAERESWRKEVYRPIYHIHKWWAKRLGSVFRGILLGCQFSQGKDLSKSFYEAHNFSNQVIFDPFMGSGTTIGEAHKLGLTALGRDINPIACEGARIAFGKLDKNEIAKAFNRIESSVGQRIKSLYRAKDRNDVMCDVLYYFWVMNAPCPECKSTVDLFSSRVIARNAYPDRKPEIQVCCPKCGDIFSSLNTEKQVNCISCGTVFNPQVGNVHGAKAKCSNCSHTFSIIDVFRSSNKLPEFKLYGKLLLTPQGNKVYVPANEEDIELYQKCKTTLERELKHGIIRLPDSVLSDGFNTRQAMSYNFRAWHDFFNKRQLLALGWLQQGISELNNPVRDILLTLFSGLLEFNNMFASYKGEGTGAVRHMFSHHILKPERVPIEANVWGTSKSSGSFLNLFKSRLIRAAEYRNNPFEVAIGENGKICCNLSFDDNAQFPWPVNSKFKTHGISLSCGSSSETNLPDKCVDAVVTDPPFFDNVHYSELADFFYAWQRLYPKGFINGVSTTRHPQEVQDTNPDKFSTKLQSIFRESNRVLKDKGLLVFTYHHSHRDGWTALVKALIQAGFSIINVHPVKAEMSVAMPKSQAKEPIQLDMIIVCRKTAEDNRICHGFDEAFKKAMERASDKLNRLISSGFKLSRNDCRIVIISHFLTEYFPLKSSESIIQSLVRAETELEETVDRINENHTNNISTANNSYMFNLIEKCPGIGISLS